MDTRMSPRSLWISFLFVIGFTVAAVLLFGGGKNMSKAKASSPSGVLYFSNGASIEKLDLKTRKREEIIPWFDREGKHKSNSIFPVYSSKEKKMYFFRSYVWPVKRQLVTFDLESQKEEEIQDLDSYIEALSLSPDEQWFAYLLGGLVTDPTGERAEPRPKRLVVRNLKSGEERVVAEGLNPYFTQAPIWVSNKALLYWDISEHMIRVNIFSKEKEDMNFKGLEPCAVSPDGKKVIAIDRRSDFDSTIYVLDLERKKPELVKRFSHFSLQGAFIWSPNGTSFVYTRQSWSNLLPFQEVGNLYWYDLATKREIKLADTVSLVGGFWLAEDPAVPEK